LILSVNFDALNSFHTSWDFINEGDTNKKHPEVQYYSRRLIRIAVHDDIESIGVAVRMNGQDIREYETENDDSTHDVAAVRDHEDRWTVTKYIESVTDANFSIKLLVHPEYHATSPKLGFNVWVDGVVVRELHVAEQHFKTSTWQYEIDGAISMQRSGNSALHKFKFSKIETGKLRSSHHRTLSRR
jgi:hypothetical protein